MKYTKYKNLTVSLDAKNLIDKGFTGNGCGSGWVSRFLCYVALSVMEADLKDVWLIHDAEYTITHKSVDHKIEADANAHSNINHVLGVDRDAGKYDRKRIFSKWIHIILVFKGFDAYWNK